MRYRARDARLKLRRALCAVMAGALALAYPAAADELAWTNEGTTLRCAGRTIVIRDPQQVNVNVYWFALDPNHASYAATLTALEAAADDLPSGYGTYAVADGANGYTGLKIVGPTYGLNGLSISASGVCRDIFNYICSKNPNYAAVSWRTNEWGDRYKVWGQFQKAPARLSTVGEDARLADAKGLGSKTIIYIGQDNAGTGDGSSYLNRRRVKDFLDLFSGGAAATVNPATFDIVVLCGRLSRFLNEGPQTSLFAGQGLYFKTGTSGARTQIVSHPTDRASLMGGPKLGSSAHGEAADFTNEGGGEWSLIIAANSGPGGADLTLGATDQHVMTDAGGTLRAIRKYSSRAALQAASEGYFIQQDYSGSDDRIYVKLADGSNPKHTTYFGEAAAGGVQFVTGDTQHFDVYGVKFYQQAFLGAFHSGVSDFTYHACGFHYVHHTPMFKHNGGFVVEATGLYDQTVGDPDPVPYNRKWIGCEMSHGYVFIYDATGTYIVPVNTTIQDCYLHHWNLLDNYGHTQDFSSSDAHTITCQGCDGWYILNNRLDTIGSQPLVIYLLGNNYNTPDPVLALTPGYVDGWGYPSRAIDNGDGTFFSPGMCKNVRFADNLITGVLTAANDPGYDTNGQGIALQGGQALIGILGQFDNIIVERNRLEGNFTEAALRTKLSFIEGQTSFPIFRRNVVRGSKMGFVQIQTTTIAGVDYDPSWYFIDNDIHVTGTDSRFMYVVNFLNPTRHVHHSNRNIFRNDGGGKWEQGGGTIVDTLAAWRLLVPPASNDVYDTDSVHIPLAA